MLKIEYILRMPRPETHYFHVEIRLGGISADSIDLVLPAWTPGSYRIRDYARHIQDFTAAGKRWKKIDKSRWRIWTGGKREIRVQYRVWAHDLTVRTSHLDTEHAYLNGGNIFLYLEGSKDCPSTLEVEPPRGWRVATGLEEKARNRYLAPDYDTLVDSPIEIGRFRELMFRAGRKQHRIVIDGGGNYDEKKILRDTKKIVEATSGMMGDMPYRDYTFIIHPLMNLRGGLEHRNSSCIQFPAFEFRREQRYESFLCIITHEYFHTWNVKRIRPEPLGPFDYEKEVYTRLLWVMEGLTCHYEILIPTRAKVFSPDDYLRILAGRIRGFLSKPGRYHQSLEESSFDTWIKLYQPSPNSVNSQVNYYEKGSLVSLFLDLEIRRKTGNRKSLDDVVHSLYREYGKKDTGFPESEFQKTCERVAGGTLSGFFRDYVRGTKEIPFNRFLGYAGLEWKERPRKGEEQKKELATAWTGIVPAKEGRGQLLPATILEGSPAEKAGLSPNDEIVAIDGARATEGNWTDRIEDCVPGEKVEVTYFRLGFLRKTTLDLKARPSIFWEIRRKKNPTPLQKKIYRGWLGAPYRSDS